MTSKNKLYLAAALLLLAIAILLGPLAKRDDLSNTAPQDTIATRSASRHSAVSSPASDASRPSRDFIAFAKHSAENKFPVITSSHIQSYLEAHQRNAGSLIAAYFITKDEALLEEAKAKFPNDPQVIFTKLRFCSDPATRLKILAELKQADPENGLAYGSSARALFDLGRQEEGMAELAQAVGRPMDDKTLTILQNTEEAYLMAGLPTVEAKILSMLQATKSEILVFSKLADQLAAMRKTDAAAGDDAAVQSSRDIQLALAQQIRDNDGCMADWLVAMGVERGVLREMDTPESSARMEELERMKRSMIEDGERIPTLMQDPAIPQSDWILYTDRIKLSGHQAANEWILKKYPDR